jgi:hypothetical protein
MQYGQKPDQSSQVLRIGRNGQQRFRYRAEQNAVNLAGILQRQTADLLGQSKYHVEVTHGQQFGFPFGQPFGAGKGLTLWTMPVPARVV